MTTFKYAPIPNTIDDITAGLWVVLNGEVLSANHAVTLEPLAAELLGGSIGSVGPLDDMAKPYLLSVGEGIARDGDEGVLLGVEHTGGRVHTESLHVGGLESPSNAASGRVGHLKERKGALKTILVPGWVAISPGGTDWAMSTTWCEEETENNIFLD
ncbi:hypothetical protein PRIPAC_91006 [Pristionchus pacificus]|uniref:Uncharacterized protein n=1 Tax=Pristionchus pacificus TaxID=54126 RepID=A0A2A6CY41_PRIPA|nr:hypothetical protein PRIPAC_91006 [Pristionchus pacificus]|eukprot:PDM83134.1 hypothetical protein PRIPAC_37527 [Pristionchus pacificus]